MPFGKKIVLHVRSGDVARLDDLVRTFIADGVKFVAVAGQDCAAIEDRIDDLVIGDGSGSRFVLTTSHPGETLDEVIAFARMLTVDHAGDIELVELG